MKKKTTFLICLLLAFGIVFCGCKSPITVKRHPTNQPNTTWKTHDDFVTFYIDSNQRYPAYGILRTADRDIEIALRMSDVGTYVSFYYEDEYRNWNDTQVIYPFASGEGIAESMDKFVIQITSGDEYFEIGEKLVFYKMDN